MPFLVGRVGRTQCHRTKLISPSLFLRSFSLLPVTDRAYINISGPDSNKLLQGLTTNDINKLNSGSCQASAFLSAKGRIVADTLIYKYESENNDPVLVIESDAAAVSGLLRVLNMYKLRSKVKIAAGEYQAYELEAGNAESHFSGALVAAREPRLDGFFRLLFTKGAQSPEGNISAKSLDYLTSMYLNGIPRSESLLNRIPLECNMDHLHYVDFKKGCYLGQELTARTKYKGIVKKRILPFLFGPENTSVAAAASKFGYLHSDVKEKIKQANDATPLKLTEEVESGEEDEKSKPDSISTTDGAIAGTIVGAPLFFPSLGIGIGLGLFRLSHLDGMHEKGPFSLSISADGSVAVRSSHQCAPFRPAWMMDEVLESVFKV